MTIQVNLPYTLPTAQGKVHNGMLTPCQLQPVFFPGVGHMDLGIATARAHNAMAIVCKAETGFDLSTTPGGTYRTLSVQERGFAVRYTPIFNEATCWPKTDGRHRTYRGVRHYLRKKFSAPLAAPGTSKHGFGIAIDYAWANLTGAEYGITARGFESGWEWLVDNAVAFGFSWEGSLPGNPGWEPWHLRHLHGDNVSTRVLETEAFFKALS